jgi:hypothetical protein
MARRNLTLGQAQDAYDNAIAFAASHPATFHIGQRVYWRYTEGGGGGSGHRANRKTLRAATVVKVTARAVRLAVDDRGTCAPTRVKIANVTAMAD